MTAGMPGAGIGGLFYLINALWMPFREVWLASRGRSSPASRRLVVRQAGIAIGILTSMWLAAWLLAALLNVSPGIRSVTGFRTASGDARDISSFLSYSALAVSAVSLMVILLGVQTLRFIFPPRRAVARPAARLFGLLLLFFTLSSSLTVAAQQPEEQQYRVTLQANPDDSRTTFLLARLIERSNPDESERLYRRYIALEPADPWGYIVLADFYGNEQRYNKALELYNEAVRLAPEERDASFGRGRMLARSGRTEQAIEAYEKWLEGHPGDAEVWRELSRERQRAGRSKSAADALEQAHKLAPDDATEERLQFLDHASAPAIEPAFRFSRDSDGNTRMTTIVGGDFGIGDGMRGGLVAGVTSISDSLVDNRFAHFAFNTELRPRAMIRINASGGAVRLERPAGNSGRQNGFALAPTASIRMRAANADGQHRLELRFNRNLLDATPLLVGNRIFRTEAQARPDIAITRRFRIRAVGSAGRITGGGESNTRYTAGGGAGWTPTSAMELFANFQQITYAHASQAGYFAPQFIQTVEATSYMEFGNDLALVALDLGAGSQRFREYGSLTGEWRPAWRGYALLSFRLSPQSALSFEVDSYNTQAGPAVAPAAGWRYVSAATSFRWSLP